MSFSFPSGVYLASWTLPFFTVALSLPAWRRIARSAGIIDDPGARKIHAIPIPLAGGMAVLTGIGCVLMAAYAAAVFDALPPGAAVALTHGLERRQHSIYAILLGAMGMLVLGLIDDRYELKPALKFIGQVAIAAMVVAAGIRITLFLPYPWLSCALTILWILTITNAVNFLDNMNGLCGGIGMIGFWCLAWMAAPHGHYLVTAFTLACSGACAGFLLYNFPRASTFLGDSGSHLIGYLLAVCSILPHFHSAAHPNKLAVLTPLLVLALPLADLAAVVYLRWRAGKPVYVGDNNHFSHRLVRAGLSPAHAVLLLWLTAASTGAIAVFLFAP